MKTAPIRSKAPRAPISMTISLRAKALLRALASLDSIRPAVELEKLIYSEAAKRGLAVHFDLPADDDGRAA